MHETARAGRCAFPLVLMLVVLGWLGPALAGAGSDDRTQHGPLLLTEQAATAPQAPDCDYPRARPAPTSNQLAAAASDNGWVVCPPHAAAGLPAGLWFSSVTENAGMPATAQSGYRGRAPPAV